MKVVVVGAGAMGTLYGSMFQDAGNDVAFVETDPRTLAALDAAGAVITRRDGRVDTYRIPATAEPATLGSIADLVLFQVKGFGTAPAAELARPVVGPETIVLTLQNGLGNEDVLRSAYPENPLLIGVSVHTVGVTGPARYHHTGTRTTHLGPSSLRWQDHARRVAHALAGAGYDVDLCDEPEVRREIYAKWVINCGSLPTLAITGLSTDAVNDHEVVLRHCDALTREACELAAAEGVVLDPDERVAYDRELFRTAGGKASMLQDVEAGRRTEIDTISGAAVRLSDKHGIPAPLNRAMFALIKGREAAMGIRS